MKKTILLLSVLAILANITTAQKKWNIALKIGPSITKNHYWDNISSQFSELNSKYGLGLSTGLDFYRFYNKHFFFKTGINYNLKTYKGTRPWLDIESGDTLYIDYKIKDSYLTVPLLLGYKFSIKNQIFYVSGGMEVNYLFYYVYDSNIHEKSKTFTNSIDNIVPKLIISIAYLYKINDKYTLMANPEYIKGFGLEDELSIGDYLTSWRLNFGVIYKL